jgi:dipeptidyl aminopeptidase/acylaminoacyl peptidase
LIVAAATLAACSAEEEPGPRFANDPVATVESTVAGAPGGEAVRGSSLPAASPVASPAATPVDPAALLRSRGAPGRLYFRSGDELWTIAADGADPARVFRPAPDEAIAAVAASPDGDRVAVLTTGDPAAERSVSVVVLDATGKVLSRSRALEQSLGGAEGLSVGSLDWSPQGDRLLISSPSGGLVALPAGGGDGDVIFDASEAMAPGHAAWSPTGEAIAFLAPSGGERPADLFLVRTVPSPSAPEVLVDVATTGRSVGDLAWTPDGRDILYTLGGAGVGAAADLWRIATDGSERRVVVSAGSAVPVGRIALIAPSPDGEAVAYTVSVPGEEGPRFHSLWVRSLGSEAAPPVRLSVPDGETVGELWWTDAGVVFRTEPETSPGAATSPTDVALYRASPNGAPTLLFDGSEATPASPAASPSAEPDVTAGGASPVASPVTR